MKILAFTSLYPNHIWPNHGIFITERMAHFARRAGCEIKVVADAEGRNGSLRLADVLFGGAAQKENPSRISFRPDRLSFRLSRRLCRGPIGTSLQQAGHAFSKRKRRQSVSDFFAEPTYSAIRFQPGHQSHWVSQALKTRDHSVGHSERKNIHGRRRGYGKILSTPRDEARHRLDLQCSKLILSVGNLTPNKGSIFSFVRCPCRCKIGRG